MTISTRLSYPSRRPAFATASEIRGGSTAKRTSRLSVLASSYMGLFDSRAPSRYASRVTSVVVIVIRLHPLADLRETLAHSGASPVVARRGSALVRTARLSRWQSFSEYEAPVLQWPKIH